MVGEYDAVRFLQLQVAKRRQAAGEAAGEKKFRPNEIFSPHSVYFSLEAKISHF